LYFTSTLIIYKKKGIKVKSIRAANQNYGLNQSAMLDRLGFIWEHHDGKKLKSFKLDYKAFLIYKKLYGDLCIPKNFSVPATDNWPEDVWGLRLGYRIEKIRKGISYSEKAYQKYFESIGILEYKIPNSRLDNFTLVFEALLRYKELYGDLLVPRKFTISHDDLRWAPELRSLPLGLRVGSIRAGRSFSNLNQAAMLEEIGFVWDVREHNFEKFLKAYGIYNQLCNQHSKISNIIPVGFCVPDGDESWPRSFWGFKMGYIANTYRKGKQKLSKKKISMLKKVGFAF